MMHEPEIAENRNTRFTFDERPSDSPFVDVVWRTQSDGGGFFTALAESRMGLVITQMQGKTTFTVMGPETQASPSPIPEDAEFFGIVFKLGTFIPAFPTRQLVDNGLHLPEANNRTFWMQGAAWQFPDFENADTFVNRLVRSGLLAREPIVDAALNGQLSDMSVRSVQRRFLQATGIPLKMVQQIQRAHEAVTLLEQGVPILDTAYQLGYFDQSHLTNSLTRFIGQTPSQILRVKSFE